MSRVFLFNPPHSRGFTREGRCTQEAGAWGTQWPPLTLATAAALLEKEGHDVKVVDFPALGLDEAFLAQAVKDQRPDFAFWSTATETLVQDLRAALLIEESSPRTVTGVMGTHVSVCPEDALKEPAVDAVIRGEPEGIIRNLCGRGTEHWQATRGISHRDPESGEIRHNAEAEPMLPEEIPSPAWHTLDLSPYHLPLKGGGFLMVTPVRGCPYACSFCTAPIYYGKRLRQRPARIVVDEIEENAARFGIRNFFIWADTFTIDRNYVAEFCSEILDRNLKISWTCNSRVDTVSRNLLALMKKSGLWMISFGMESGNDGILSATRKDITVAQSREAAFLANDLDVRVSGHFIFGLPGETMATLKETLAFSLSLPLDIAQYYVAAPFPGTDLYREAVKNGWLRKESPASQSAAAIDLPGLPAEAVNAFRRYAYRKFYSRPLSLLKIASMMEPRGLRDILKNMGRFRKWAET